MTDRRFVVTHIVAPAAVSLAVLACIHYFGLDLTLSDRWHVNGQWLGQGENAWWARDLLHTGGGWLVRAIGLATLTTWVASRWAPGLSQWRWTLAYLVVGMALATTLIATLKGTTNIACPWDLDRYGGPRPYIGLFDPRPLTPAAHCFPGAHSGSGFALFAFYFAFRTQRPRWARVAQAAALVVGAVFAFGQEVRGAHFLSHDVASAGVAWVTLACVYVVMSRGGAVDAVRDGDAMLPRVLCAFQIDAVNIAPPAREPPAASPPRARKRAQRQTHAGVV